MAQTQLGNAQQFARRQYREKVTRGAITRVSAMDEDIFVVRRIKQPTSSNLEQPIQQIRQVVVFLRTEHYG